MRNVHPVMLVDIRLWRINQPSNTASNAYSSRRSQILASLPHDGDGNWLFESSNFHVDVWSHCYETNEIRSIFRKIPRFESILRYYTRDIPLRGILRLLLETPWSMPGRKVGDSRESWPGTDPFRVMGKVDFRRATRFLSIFYRG